jgi:hypothetical protein
MTEVSEILNYHVEQKRNLIARELFEHRLFEGVVFMYELFEKIAPLIGLVAQILFCTIPGAGKRPTALGYPAKLISACCQTQGPNIWRQVLRCWSINF